jgi:hypothetical protein
VRLSVLLLVTAALPAVTAGPRVIAGPAKLVAAVTTAAGVIDTYAGGGPADGIPATAAGLQPNAVVAASDGSFYVTGDSAVYRVDPAGVLSRVAGRNSARGFSGDGGPATSAQLDGPSGLAVDASGDLLIADSNNSRVRKVTPAGTISTIAGTGARGFSGDGGPATSAQLADPSGLAVDAGGNLLIADYGNYRVRKVTPAGTISAVAGNGTGVLGGGFSGDGGPATSAQLSTPNGVAVDASGNLLIADYGNNRVRKVTPAGTISTVAGTGAGGFSGDGGPATSAQLDGPSGVAVDAGGNLLIADYGNHRVRKVTPAGTISTVAGDGTFGFSGDGGPATSAQLDPAAMAVDAGGNLLIADYVNHRVRKVTPAGTISTVAGDGTFGFSGDGGPATSAELSYPAGVAVDAGGNLLIADLRNYRVRRVTPAGTISTVAGTGAYGFGGDGGPATSAQLTPAGVAVDASGNLLITDSGNARVRKVTPAGTISTVAGDGTFGFSGDGGAATSAGLADSSYGTGESPVGLAVDAAGNLLICDYGNSRIRVVGAISVPAGSTFTPVTPSRVLDSRNGAGGYSTPWGAGVTRSVTVGGVGGVPANATAVVLNVTATNPRDTSYLTVYPAGVAQPVASNLNFTAGQTVPNLVVVGVGTNGQVNILNDRSTVDVIGDVVGYYAPTGGSTYTPVTPSRVLDSRNGAGGYSTPWGAGVTRPVTATGGGTGVPATAKAVIINITATNPHDTSYLTVYPAGVAQPVASNLNFTAGQTVPNLVIVGVGTNNQINILNDRSTVDVIGDVVGYYN